MDIFSSNEKLRSTSSVAQRRLPKGRARGASITVRGASSLFIFLVVALASCTKNSQPRPNETREGDTVTKVQELRDSISRSLVRPEAIAPGERTQGDTTVQGKASMQLDTIEGTVYVSGNEPFTRLTLALAEKRGNIFLEADTIQSKQLRRLQGRVVRVSGPTIKSGTGDCIRVNEFVIVR